MRRNGLAVAAAAVAVLLVGAVIFLPGWIVRNDLGPGDISALSAADRLQAVTSVRTTLLQGLAGLAALGGIALGTVVTMRQVRVSREGQFIDLFTRAIEHLASDKMAVRHGGVYAMEQIAGAAPHYRGHVAALLAAFVRQQAPWPPARPEEEVSGERERYHGGLRDDVGGAMAVLGRRSMVLPGTGIELEKVDLRGAELAGQDLSRFCFAGSSLDGATLSGCDLSGATFAHASLRDTDLTGTNLTGADLSGADLAGADLTGATGIAVTGER